MRALAAEVSDLSAASVTRALSKAFGEDEVKKRLAAARLEGGHSMNDRAIERAQNIDGKDDAPGARVEVAALQFTAKTWNREQYGDRPPQAGVQVNVSLSSMHLEALRRRAALDRAADALPVLPAEVISITDGDSSEPEPDAPAPARSLEAGNRADSMVRDEG